MKGGPRYSHEGDTPRPVGRHVGGTEGDGGSRDRSTEPTGVVETGHATTPLRRCNLDTVRRRAGRSDGDTPAEDEATGGELLNVVRRRGEDGADDDKHAAREHADTAAVLVGDLARHETAHDLADGVDGEDETSARVEGGGVLEVRLVGRHGGDRTHERAIVTVGNLRRSHVSKRTKNDRLDYAQRT